MARRATAKNPTTKSPKKAPPRPAAAAPDGKVLGTISTDLRVRMKGLSEELEKSRAKMANLGFAQADLKLRLTEIEGQMAQEFRVANELTGNMAKCREEMSAALQMDPNTNYRLDLNTGEVTLNQEA